MKARGIALGVLASMSILGRSALAADLPVKAPAPVPYAYTWTGFHVGGNIGWGWEHRTRTNVGTINGAAFPAGTVASGDGDGLVGGLQLGYDWQFDPNWLVGVAGEFDWSDINGSIDATSVTKANRLNHADYAYQWVASLTGRVGFVANNWLLYFKGGWAWAHRDANSTTTNTVNGKTLVTVTSGGTPSGWTIGGGAEWQFAPHWSAMVEYDYVDLGTVTASPQVTFAVKGAAPVVTGATLSRDVDANLSLLKVGVNYRF